MIGTPSQPRHQPGFNSEASEKLIEERSSINQSSHEVTDDDPQFQRANGATISRLPPSLETRSLESVAPDLIKRIGNSIQKFLTEVRCYFLSKEFISKTSVPGSQTSEDSLFGLKKILEKGLVACKGENEVSNINVFRKVFSEKLNSCSDEELSATITVLSDFRQVNPVIPNFSANAPKFREDAIKLAVARLDKRLSTNREKQENAENLGAKFEQTVKFAEQLDIHSRLQIFKELADALLSRSIESDNSDTPDDKEEIVELWQNLGMGKSTAAQKEEDPIAGTTTKLEEVNSLLQNIFQERAEILGDLYGDSGEHKDKEELQKNFDLTTVKVSELEQRKARLLTDKYYQECKLTIEKAEMEKLRIKELLGLGSALQFGSKFYV